MRQLVAIFFVLLGSVCLCPGQTSYSSSGGSVPVPGHGDAQLGSSLSFPGNALSATGQLIPASAYPTASYCGRCHPQALAHWRQSLHSNSFRTPFYRNSVNILARTKGIELTRHCDSCHNPVGVLSGALTKDSNIDRSFDSDGLTCMTCHSIQKLQPLLGNGGYVMETPAVMTDAQGNRIPGEMPDSEILGHPDRHAKAVMKDFYRSAEFCSACHKANLPNGLNDYKWLRAFSTYDDWQNSKFSTRNPLTFYHANQTTCQGCHMKRVLADAEEKGAKKGTFAQHRWPAGNTAIPFYYGFDEQLDKTIEFLKSSMYLKVDVFGTQDAAPLGSVPVTFKPNQAVQILVVVQNKNIGHSLIPEVRDLYEAWLEFSVQDGGGKEIYHSGFLKPDGSLDPSAHSFTNRPVNLDGEFVDNHKVWTIHSMAYDNTVQAGRSALVRYEFRIPAEVKGGISMTARVNYRHFRQSYLDNVLGKEHAAYPVVQLASRTRSFKLGKNAPVVTDPDDNPEWMRWNNVGIGYLDQAQYSEALHAFGEVVKLRPDYADGYTNLAVTNIGWEKYHEARPSLAKALQFAPNDARALYYLALVERREGNADCEIADLENVVRQYPQSRDARRELGISYYQQHRYQESREQFEALQSVDPDDLAAHYNLAVVYRRLGMKKEAAEQSAMFSTKQVDPGAPTYSLGFLGQHPEMRIESSPWHVHSSVPGATDDIK